MFEKVSILDGFVTTVDDDKAFQEDVKLFRPKYCKKMSIRRMKEYITKGVQVNQDRLKMAKEEAERAIKVSVFDTLVLNTNNILPTTLDRESKRKSSQSSDRIRRCVTHCVVAVGWKSFII
jgi:hypothetical protein